MITKANIKKNVIDAVKNWTLANIFKTRKWDSMLYLILYIVIPVITTWVSSIAIGDTDVAMAAYFFLTTGISAFSCLYDIASRWDSDGNRIINLKLFIIAIPITAISIYCLSTLIYTLVSNKVDLSSTWVFYLYLIPLIICIHDICFCFINDILRKENEEDKQ